MNGNEPHDSALRATPLQAAHRERKSRMIPFAGWNMPVQYPTGIVAEHLHTRRAASVFDTCHMGEIRVAGPDAAAALDGVLARSVRDQRVGTCRYNLLLSDNGGIYDDLIAYRMEKDVFFIVVNAGTREQDAAVLDGELSGRVSTEDVSDDTGKIDLQGPSAAVVLEKLGLDRRQLPGYFHWAYVDIGGHPVLLSRTGYTGELGFELYLPWERTSELWERILREPGVLPAGLGARDTLRLEAGLPLYGHELALDLTPVEAGFGFMLEPGATPRGDAALRAPVRKRLVGLKLKERRTARDGAVVYDGDRRAGRVTSGSFAPSLGHAVALAYLDGEEPPPPGTPYTVEERGRRLDATVAKLPFYAGGTARMKLGEG